jgi:hypothetical protein
MTRIVLNVAAALSLLVTVALPTEASARICKRICQDGVCWSDCSKLPGERNSFGTVFKGD